MKKLALCIVSLRRGPKKLLLASADFAALAFLLWVVISLRYRDAYVPSELLAGVLFISAPVIGVAAIAYRRLYHEVTRYLSPRGYSLLAGTVLLASIVWCSVIFLLGQEGIPRSSALVFVLAAPMLVVMLRQGASQFLSRAGIFIPDATSRFPEKKIIVIGSGRLAVRYLSSELNRSKFVVAMIDGASSQVGRSVQGVRVQNWDRLPGVLEEHVVSEAVIASDNPSDDEVLNAIRFLRARGILCRAYSELAINSGKISKHPVLREFEIRDVLPRNVVPPDVERLRQTFRGSRVLITGAGGSIGSELVTQILSYEPELVVLLDNSEVALHRITLKSQDLIALSGFATAINPVLASVTDEHRIDAILSTSRIDTVFHAAALKHVPLLEAEPKAAVVTNVLGTRIVAQAAGLHEVKRFVLVSTDKAVRPSSVMGSTKRAAELIVTEAGQRFDKTIFSSVRFGNVLGSSGSVVERFNDQIRSGGPVTVTHPEMTRYFMTVEEAASLVMEAGALAQGGETFILDMGQPHAILDLAKTMIGLMGYSIRSSEAPAGDIEITFTGMRPGEKLHEELMIDASLAVGTAHPKITMLPGASISPALMQIGINRLKEALESSDERKIVRMLNSMIQERSDREDVTDTYEEVGEALIH